MKLREIIITLQENIVDNETNKSDELIRPYQIKVYMIEDNIPGLDNPLKKEMIKARACAALEQMKINIMNGDVTL